MGNPLIFTEAQCLKLRVHSAPSAHYSAVTFFDCQGRMHLHASPVHIYLVVLGFTRDLKMCDQDGH